MRVSQYSLPPGISEISPASGSVLQDTTRNLNEPRARSRLEAPGAGDLQAGWSRSYETRAPHALWRRAGRTGEHPLQALGPRGAGDRAYHRAGSSGRKPSGHAAAGRRLVGTGSARARRHALPLPGRWQARGAGSGLAVQSRRRARRQRSRGSGSLPVGRRGLARPAVGGSHDLRAARRRLLARRHVCRGGSAARLPVGAGGHRARADAGRRFSRAPRLGL